MVTRQVFWGFAIAGTAIWLVVEIKTDRTASEWTCLGAGCKQSNLEADASRPRRPVLVMLRLKYECN